MLQKLLFVSNVVLFDLYIYPCMFPSSLFVGLLAIFINILAFGILCYLLRHLIYKLFDFWLRPPGKKDIIKLWWIRNSKSLLNATIEHIIAEATSEDKNGWFLDKPRNCFHFFYVFLATLNNVICWHLHGLEQCVILVGLVICTTAYCCYLGNYSILGHESYTLCFDLGVGIHGGERWKENSIVNHKI